MSNRKNASGADAVFRSLVVMGNGIDRSKNAAGMLSFDIGIADASIREREFTGINLDIPVGENYGEHIAKLYERIDGAKTIGNTNVFSAIQLTKYTHDMPWPDVDLEKLFHELIGPHVDSHQIYSMKYVMHEGSKALRVTLKKRRADSTGPRHIDWLVFADSDSSVVFDYSVLYFRGPPIPDYSENFFPFCNCRVVLTA